MNNKKVLVVDDSMMIRNALTRVFSEVGVEVEEAADGIEALSLLESASFNLVMCDLNMPNMSGMELLQASQKLRKERGTSVVMLTTEGRPEFVVQARELGANGWLVKPFQNEQILLLAKRFLS